MCVCRLGYIHHMYIYMYTCMYPYAHVHMHTYIYMGVYTHKRVADQIYMYIANLRMTKTSAWQSHRSELEAPAPSRLLYSPPPISFCRVLCVSHSLYQSWQLSLPRFITEPLGH